MENKDDLTREELMKMLRYSELKTGTMYNLLRSGIIPIKRLDGKQYIFSRQVILKLMGINHDIHEPFLTPKEAAQILGINQIDVASYTKFHKIPFYKLVNKKGAQCLYLKSEIDAAMNPELHWNNISQNIITQKFNLHFVKKIIDSEFISKLAQKHQFYLKEILVNEKTFEVLAKEIGVSDETIKTKFNKACYYFMVEYDTISKNIISQRKYADEINGLHLKINELKANNEQLRLSLHIKQDFLSEIKKEDLEIKHDLSTRALNFLKLNKIEKIQELSFYTRHDLSKFRNIGAKTLNELEDALKAVGLDWKK